MQDLQGKLENISGDNSKLEQEFENEINRKNQESKEMGMVIKAINNIYETCYKQNAKKSNN